MKKSAGLLLGGLAGAALTGWLLRRRGQTKSVRNRTLAVTVVGDSAQARVLAVHCARVGLDVSLLMPGGAIPSGRLARLSYSELLSGVKRSAHVRVVADVDSGRACDLAIVWASGSGLAKAMDAARALSESCPVVFMMDTPNSLTLVEATLGEPSTLIGSLNWIAVEGTRAVHAAPVYLARPILGESSGKETPRLREAALALRQAGLNTETTTHITSWLWSHAGMLATLAGSVQRHGSLRRFALSPTGLADYLAQVRDLCLVLEANGMPVSRALRRRAALGPESLSVWFLRLFLATPGANALFALYTEGLLPELEALMVGLRSLAAQVDLPVPALESPSASTLSSR